MSAQPVSSRLSGLIRDRRGTAAIEFGILAPILILMLTSGIEIGFAVHDTMQVHHAAEAGALYASKQGWDVDGITRAVVAATGAKALTTLPVLSRYCGCVSAYGPVQFPCGERCKNGGLPGVYISVEAQQKRRSVVPTLLPLPSILSSRVVFREE